MCQLHIHHTNWHRNLNDNLRWPNTETPEALDNSEPATPIDVPIAVDYKLLKGGQVINPEAPRPRLRDRPPAAPHLKLGEAVQMDCTGEPVCPETERDSALAAIARVRAVLNGYSRPGWPTPTLASLITECLRDIGLEPARPAPPKAPGQPMTIHQFLLARIVEDEAIAHAAVGFSDAERWDADSDTQTVRGLTASAQDVLRSSWWDGDLEPHAPVLHAAHWDPHRVLAESESKRRIIEWHKSWPVLVETAPTFDQTDYDLSSMTLRMSQKIMWQTDQEYRDRFGTEPPTGPVLRMLALPYADHPDYNADWADGEQQ